MLLAACVGESTEFVWPEDSSQIQMSRSGGGFDTCEEVGDVTSASISHFAGSTEIEGRIVQPGDFEEDGYCLNDPYDYGDQEECLVSDKVEARHISAEEYDQIREAIAEIPQKECTIDPDRICHYCLRTTITVDDHSVSNECCGELNEGFIDAFYEAVDVLERVTRGESDRWELE